MSLSTLYDNRWRQRLQPVAEGKIYLGVVYLTRRKAAPFSAFPRHMRKLFQHYWIRHKTPGSVLAVGLQGPRRGFRKKQHSERPHNNSKPLKSIVLSFSPQSVYLKVLNNMKYTVKICIYWRACQSWYFFFFNFSYRSWPFCLIQLASCCFAVFISWNSLQGIYNYDGFFFLTGRKLGNKICSQFTGSRRIFWKLKGSKIRFRAIRMLS